MTSNVAGGVGIGGGSAGFGRGDLIATSGTLSTTRTSGTIDDWTIDSDQSSIWTLDTVSATEVYLEHRIAANSQIADAQFPEGTDGFSIVVTRNGNEIETFAPLNLGSTGGAQNTRVHMPNVHGSNAGGMQFTYESHIESNTSYVRISVSYLTGLTAPSATTVAIYYSGTGRRGRTGPQGEKGWSPVYAGVEDGDRRVFQVSDWVGGAGDKPATGAYVGASGLTSVLADATDFRGEAGDDANLTQAEIQRLLGLDNREVSNLVTGASVSGNTLTLNRNVEPPVVFTPTGTGQGDGLTAVARDDTLTGDGTSGSRLGVANPFTDDDETKLDGIEVKVRQRIRQQADIRDVAKSHRN